jgi:uncharacterized membrane protein YphA (DoxX/SURF4 family)
MNILLWVLQVFAGLYFIAVGVNHFIIPPGLPSMMAWMYELSPTLHIIAGVSEILGGLGLILPGLTRIQTRLTPLAAVGLALVMIGAVVWHLQRGEFSTIVLNLINIALVAFIAYGRWKLVPLEDRGSTAAAI